MSECGFHQFFKIQEIQEFHKNQLGSTEIIHTTVYRLNSDEFQEIIAVMSHDFDESFRFQQRLFK